MTELEIMEVVVGKEKAKELKIALNVVDTIQRIKIAMTELEETYQKRKAMLKEEIDAARKSCPHTKTTYHSDPSGNNDSYYSCDICGVEV